jgi:DNA polymerase gamma 1
MLPDWLYKQVFNRPTRPVPPKNLVEISMEHLKKQGYCSKKADTVPNINQFELPKLCGKTISEHFWRIGEEQARPIRDLAMRLVGTSLPAMPLQANWILLPGWTRYEEGKPPNAVDYPNESFLCFNTKTFDEYKYPLIACAASSTAWYSWISPRLLSNGDGIDCGSKYLIPMGNIKKSRLIVGHSVGIDRTRIKEEYHYTESNISFLDTQSLHIAVSGICSRLKNDWNKYNKAYKNRNNQYLLQEKKFRKIYDVSSVNDLHEVYKFYCNQCLNKTERDVFVKGTFEEFQDTKNLQQAIAFCATDVEAIHQIFQKLFPMFIDVCPHPVSFAGVVQMGSMFLTTNKDWERFVINSETKYKSLNESIESTLEKLADKTLKERNHYQINDPWLKQLDWKIKSNNQPEWYNKIYNKNTNKVRVTALSQIAPILLKLKWLNYPVCYSKQYGWMYRVPVEDKHFITNSELCEFPTQPEHIYYEPCFSEDKSGSYYCIPNKNGRTSRCGTPLAKKYICDFENGTLQSDFKEAEEILKFHAACTYWMSIRDRIKSQLLIYSGYSGIDNFGFDMNDGENIGIILPRTLTMGTITRRVVENTWATATNPREYLIGSEQKSMIKAPKGYKIVGADVDSQEMWISSLISDAEFGFHGATGLGLMMLQGSKSDGTDLHSRTAKILGISRDDAKVFNYSRLYGAGIKTVLGMLEKSFANINVEEAKERVEILFKKTKGQRYYRSNINGQGFWFGGSETYLVNRLEEIATSLEPLTPVLRCGITNALKPANADQKYMTSRVNWVVQSSGVDYLHLLLVSMKYLIKKYNINARFMLSVHDDVRYLVKENDTYRAALALQISNLWTRAMFSHMLGIEDLPLVC